MITASINQTGAQLDEALVSQAANRVITRDLRMAGLDALVRARAVAPVKTGRLRAGISTKVAASPIPTLTIYNDVPYSGYHPVWYEAAHDEAVEALKATGMYD